MKVLGILTGLGVLAVKRIRSVRKNGVLGLVLLSHYSHSSHSSHCMVPGRCGKGNGCQEPWEKPDELRYKANRVREDANRVRDKPYRIRAEPARFREKAPAFRRPSDFGTFFRTCRNGIPGNQWYYGPIFREESTDFPDFCHIFKELQERWRKNWRSRRFRHFLEHLQQRMNSERGMRKAGIGL